MRGGAPGALPPHSGAAVGLVVQPVPIINQLVEGQYVARLARAFLLGFRLARRG